ncbi:MAG: GNAT family N-acetyltransferase [Alphaproteobacteria bacterium]|nr:GNAT family N-acetyltransferase [Alphaproteobacteria bacterium]
MTSLHPYASAAYAAAFAPLEPVWLPHAATHVLKRLIPGTEHHDAMGCYPLCVMRADSGIKEDFEILKRHGCVTLVAVTDCLSQPDEAFLSAHFDRCRRYKTHYVHDARLANADYSKHHRDRIRRARKSCETRVVNLADHLDAWMECYTTLVKKKNITGIQNFPREYFAAVAAMPEAVTIAAFVDGVFASGHIWMRHEGLAYAHLAASTELGYKLRCAFPIYDDAIQMLKADHIIDFGGGAGAEESEADGLRDFKKGFANAEKRNFLCGKILNAELYQSLCNVRGVDPDAAFFPAYRSAG